MRYGIAEIMQKASGLPHRERVDFLRANDSFALRAAFRLAYDPGVIWDLPKGWKPDYTPSIFLDQQSNLPNAMKRVGKFLVDGYPGLTREKKQLLFVQMLESLDPLDAKLMVAVKDGRIPFKGLGRKAVGEAFPELNITTGQTSAGDADLCGETE